MCIRIRLFVQYNVCVHVPCIVTCEAIDVVLFGCKALHVMLNSDVHLVLKMYMQRWHRKCTNCLCVYAV